MHLSSREYVYTYGVPNYMNFSPSSRVSSTIARPCMQDNKDDRTKIVEHTLDSQL